MAKILVSVGAMLDPNQRRKLQAYYADAECNKAKAMTNLVVHGLEALGPKATTAAAPKPAPKPPAPAKPKPKVIAFKPKPPVITSPGDDA